MDVISPPSDEFAKHDLLITSMRKDNFQRLAGEQSYTYFNSFTIFCEAPLAELCL